MIVEFGNPAPTAQIDGGSYTGPVVTYCGPLPDDPEYGYSPHPDASVLAVKLAQEMETAERERDGIYRVGDISDGTGFHEAFLTAVNGWRAQASAYRGPTWVWSDSGDFAVLLGHFFGCPVGRPADVEDTHRTLAGPPGVHPPADVPEPEVAS